MPADQHAEPPPDPAPPPSRRDHETPAAGHHGQNDQDDRLRDAWLSEMWAPVREFHPATEPKKKPKKARKKRSTGMAGESPSISTGCAETGAEEMPGSAA